MPNKEAIFITKWKKRMRRVIKLRYGNDLNNSKIDKYLDTIIKTHMKNPKATIVNNYTGNEAHSDVLTIIDLIEENKLIIGGGGVLYGQHGLKLNVLIGYILQLKADRNKHKNNRKLYDKTSFEWLMEDIFQNNVKTKNNSLYGTTGYPRFQIYNRFNAEATTNCGRQIICTAIMTFENFLGGGMFFNTEGEVYTFIDRITTEYKKKYNRNLDCSVFKFDNIDKAVLTRIIGKCEFNVEDSFVIALEEIVKFLSYEEKVLLYYKNNLFEFSKNPFILAKSKYIMESLDEFNAPEISLVTDQTVAQTMNDIMDFYTVFVIYDYPIFDRVRKAMYTDRKVVLYVDTDSNFLALHPWVRFIKEDVLGNHFNKPEKDVEFISVNLIAYYLSFVIDKRLHTLCKHMNVTKKYADMLFMKNEFYLDTILFGSVKKRYILNAILQEGDLLKGGRGIPEIKGFDFKKSVTKEYVREYFTSICENDILRAKEIDVEDIFFKMLTLQKDIEDSMKAGESKYYKQANVQEADYYANPYSQQGIRGILLWNCLCPEYAMEPPTDVDIIPIVDIGGIKTAKGTFKNFKAIEWFKSKYPEEYKKIDREIYNNPNPLIAKMALTYIAKPKNADIILPDWFADLVNTQKVVLDTLGLFYPILQSLGLKILKTNAQTHYLSNIVDL